MSKFKSRIIGEGAEKPDQLLANPANYRRHPKEQLEALEGALEEIGWIQRVIVNETTGHIVDGHARVELAIRRGEAEVPVLYVQLSENEERLALATIDPITGLAYQDDEALAELLASVEAENDALAAFLDSMQTDQGTGSSTEQSETRTTLAEQFLIPPFTVLDARQGYWQDRKRMWLSLGIRSEEGRGQSGDKTGAKGLIFGFGTQPGAVWDRKREIEARDGTEYSWTEFAEKYPEEIRLAGDSIFDPVLCEISYRWYCPPGGDILDPFAGGSVRGVVAGVLGYHYTGIDLRPEQIEANERNWGEITRGGPLKPRTTPDNNTPDYTPIEQHGEAWAKRDDMFVFAGSRGGKVRSCLALSMGADGLVTAGSRHSPQANIVAGIAAAKGIPARVHVPSGALTDELRAAQAAGAEIVQHTPGYNSVIVARAREDAQKTGWTEIPFGMECQEAIEQTRRQVTELPEGVQRIVVAVGSGMSLAGILHGLRDTGQDIPVLGIMVGADPKKRLDQYAPKDWRERVKLKKAGTPYDQPAAETMWSGIALDPHYEAKAAPHVQSGDLFWIVGRRQSAEPQDDSAPVQAIGTAPRWIAADSLKMNDHLEDDQQVDFIFSCPPYADLEVYSDDPADISAMAYDDFLAVYRDIIALACKRLRDNRFAVFVVGDVRDKRGFYRNFVSDTIEAFRDAGLHLYNEAILVTPTGSLAMRAGSQFRASRKLGKGHQNVLVFAKGDPAQAPAGDPMQGLGAHLAEHFAEHRTLLEAHEKVLVFVKGDPKAATDQLGPALIDDPAEFGT